MGRHPARTGWPASLVLFGVISIPCEQFRDHQVTPERWSECDHNGSEVASAHPGVTLLSKPFGLRELQNHLERIGLG